ncbi:zinc-binding dehydrogenase [Nocardia sp. NPDC050718]|uniref:zinc-binding dehydrogenase n=1 Tax=Nocardia sp. NPDC050718 TaxID=3155788 RepID=UPI0033E5582D
MRAVVVHSFGGPEALELVDVPVPVPGPGQVRIRVAAAAVNPVDAVTRTGALVDAVLDTAGLSTRALAAVRNRGSFVTVVGGADPIPLRGIRVHHTWISADGAALATLAAYDLTLRVADTLPLEHAARAHTRLAEGGLRGRLVLTTAPGGGS